MSRSTPFSVRKLAIQLKLSVATVSRALNQLPGVQEETRTRVLQAARKAGYVPPQVQGNLSAVGYAYLTGSAPLTINPYESSLLNGLLQGLNEYKCDLVMLQPERDRQPDESYTRYFKRKGVRGVLLRPLQAGRANCEQIAAEAFPHVVLAERFETPGVNFVYCNSRMDSRRAGEHLLDLGHTKIAFCVHAIPDQDHKDREEGFAEALKARGLELPEQYIVRVNADLEGGSQALIRLMSLREPPTAVYCADPWISVGLLRRALQCGLRVPEELSIIGFDDGDLRRMLHPMLTAVVQNATRLGVDAATWLARMLTQNTEPVFQHHDQTFFEINATTTRPTIEPVRLLPDGSRM